MKKLIPFLALLSFQLCAAITPKQLTLPQGFKLEIYAADIEHARQLAVSDSGMVFVGSMRAGKVYALLDQDNDGKAEKRWLIAKGLNMPSGLALQGGDLYVAAVNQVIKFPNIEAHLKQAKSEIFYDKLPSDRHHGWKFIRFAANGNLIIPVGAPCNICEAPTKMHSRILSLDMKTKKLTELAQGVRNSVGFDFHPDSGELWFSDNGRDMLGDDIPPDEINRISQVGAHYGYPYFHAGDIADPKFGQGKNKHDYIAPVLKLDAHVAPLGLHFYRGKAFPAAYHKQLFVAEHGSWNRSKKSGYKVGLITLNGSEVIKYESFIIGFMKNEETLGRPVAFAELADGSLLISDDFAHQIYRVSYAQ